MTLPHFSFSAARNFPNSAGEVAKTFSPQSVMVCLILGSARPALIALLSVSMIGAGVFLGATTSSGHAGVESSCGFAAPLAQHTLANCHEHGVMHSFIRTAKGNVASPEVPTRRSCSAQQ